MPLHCIVSFVRKKVAVHRVTGNLVVPGENEKWPTGERGGGGWQGEGGGGQGCIRREGASEAAPEAVKQAVGGGCQSGWGQRLLSVTNAIEAGTWCSGDSG